MLWWWTSGISSPSLPLPPSYPVIIWFLTPTPQWWVFYSGGRRKAYTDIITMLRFYLRPSDIVACVACSMLWQAGVGLVLGLSLSISLLSVSRVVDREVSVTYTSLIQVVCKAELIIYHFVSPHMRRFHSVCFIPLSNSHVFHCLSGCKRLYPVP